MLFASTTNFRHFGSRRGATGSLVVFGIVATTLLGAGVYYLMSQDESQGMIDPILSSVKKGEFVSQVLDQGEVQSSENVEIRCEVRARNGSISVIEVVPEGTMVKAGDFLVQLDSTAFEKELETQKIAVASAETAVIQADADLRVAKEAKNEYIQGTFEQMMLEIENEIADAQSEIKTAKQEFNQAKAVHGHSIKLAQKGFITNQQKEADKFAVEKARLAVIRGENSLKLGNTKKMVLKDITYNKEIIQYDSDVEAAKVRLGNQKESLEVERGQLAEINEMIEKCRIVVPEGVQGQVVYAKESSRGGNDWILEEGTTVRERQVLVRLPNPDKMEVKALINEQSITQIRPGMPAEIRVDALSGVTLKGIVTKVNQYAESSGWMSSNIRKYAVLVRILNPPETLKPGMNASVVIQVRYEQDALMAPIQAVYAVGDQQFCLVRKAENQWETREIKVVADNSQVVLIESGVEAGEDLVMNPGAFKELMDLPESKLEQKIEVPESAVQEATKNADEEQPNAPTSGQNAEQQKAGQGRRGPGQGQGRRGGGSPGDMLKRLDKNSDGKLDAEEISAIDERFRRFITRLDTDNDGEVSADELSEGMKRMMRQRGGGQ